MKLNIKSFIVFVFVVGFLAVLPAKAQAHTNYYVAGDTGLDTNSGSISAPWKTIQKAANTMVAGDTVNVKGGVTYTGSNSCNGTPVVVCVNVAGSAGNYITYQAWQGTPRHHCFGPCHERGLQPRALGREHEPAGQTGALRRYPV